MGLPVVSFATGVVPESVHHGETGFLAPERDWKTLTQYILCLLENSDLWERLSQQGPKFIQKTYNLTVQTQQLEHLYHDRILNGSHSQRVSHHFDLTS